MCVGVHFCASHGQVRPLNDFCLFHCYQRAARMDGHQRSMSFSGHFASRTGGNTTHSNSPAGCRQWRCHVVALLAAAPALARPSPCWPSPLTTPVSGVCTASGLWCPAATPADPASSPEIVSAGCGCVPPIIAHFEELSTPIHTVPITWEGDAGEFPKA